jgi:quercetin dioxygenase-like cupin family protein
VSFAGVAHADEPGNNSSGGRVGGAGAVSSIFDRTIPNIPGKSVVAQEVSYPPGGGDAAHHHAVSAFIMAYVLSGTIRSQVEGEPERIYHMGETWYEDPGAHHVLAENASNTQPAKILAVFVVDTNDTSLTTFDPTAGDGHD